MAGPEANPFVVLSESGLKMSCDEQLVKKVLDS